MVIDFHTHIFPPEIIEERDEYCHKDRCFSLLYSDARAKLSTVEQLIASMDEYGIDKSVALNIAWGDHDICVRTNEYILDAASKYPGRIIGFGMVQPLDGDKAIKELEKCLKSGMQGIGEMRTDTQGYSLADTAILRPVIDTLVAHDKILLIHASEPVGHQYTGKGKITPDVIYLFLTNFPELKTVCAHFGGGLPFYELMPEVKKALANTYFDSAAAPYLYSAAIYRHVLEVAGNEKVLFGSDYPLMSPSKAMAQIDSLGLPDDIKHKITSGNAELLLNTGK
jgi:uncharacterized protein